MTIDWFTVVAQIINFLILVWLLKRFLYQPILDAIDTREQRIVNELKNADTIQNEAQNERDKFAQKNAEFEQQKQLLIQAANQAADAERTRLIAAARAQADALGEKRQQALEREQLNISTELRRLVRDEVFAIARKTLTDLADARLEQSITDIFIGRLQTMQDEAKKTFINVVAGRSLSSDKKDPVLVCSAFNLQPQQKAAIQTALNTTLSADIPLQFEIDDKVIGGISLSVKGQQISWSIDEYLASLEKRVGELLQSVIETNSAATKSLTPVADKIEPVPEPPRAKKAEEVAPTQLKSKSAAPP